MLKNYKLILILVSIALLAGIIWIADPAKLAEIVSKSNPVYIILGFVVSIVSLSFRVSKWWVLLDGVSYRELFPIQILGMTISTLTPGKAAEPLKAFLLKTRKGINVSESLASIIWERILDVIILIAFSVVAIQLMGLSTNLMIISFISIGIFSMIIILFLSIMYSKKFGVWFFNKIKKLPLLNKISDTFMSTFYGTIIKKRRIIFSFILTTVPWILEGVIVYLAFLSLGITTSPLMMSGIFALSTLIGVASSLPGGIGSSEVAMVIMLGMTGIESTMAIAGILIARFMSMWFGLFIGGLSFVYLSRKINLTNLFSQKT